MLAKIASAKDKITVDISDKVALGYYRLQKIAEGDIILDKGREGKLIFPTEAGLRQTQEERELLSPVLRRI